jgi:hypothetical protein
VVLTFATKEVGLLSVGRFHFLSPLFLVILFTVNAASKGHLPVVMYLLSKKAADPLVRNNWGETAYDVAASVFEVWICEVLTHAILVIYCLMESIRSCKKPRQSGGAVQLHHTICCVCIPLFLWSCTRINVLILV